MITTTLWNIVKNSGKTFARTKSLQEVINSMFYSKNKVIIEPGYINYVVTKDNNKYYMSKLLDTVRQVQQDYIFDDIREADIVIDIGACIGGFCIPASRRAKYVYAVEPMTPDMLRENVLLNKRDNIDVLEIALGDGKTAKLEWLGESKTVKTKTLSEIISFCGGCDFLKCDCEGWEWFIQPDEIKGIRRIEMEYHKCNPSRFKEELLLNALSEHFELTISKWQHPVNAIGMIHARNKEIE